MTPLLAILIVIILTILVTLVTRNKIVRMMMVVPIYGIAITGAIIGGATYTRLQEQRAYDTCANNVHRSDGNREQHLAIYALMDRRWPNAGAYLRSELDKNLPARTLAECATP